MIRRYLSLPALEIPLAVVAGVVVTAALVTMVFQNEAYHQRVILTSRSNTILGAVSQQLAATDEAMHSMAALFYVSDEVDSDEFRIFAEEILHGHPLLNSIRYLPVLVDRDRDAFEGEIREDGYPSFSVTELRRDRFVSAPRRERYVPVMFQVPFAPSSAGEMGFDVLSEPEAERAILLATDGAKPIAMLSAQRDQGVAMYTVTQAVYEGRGPPNAVTARRRSIRGFVMGRGNAQSLLDGISQSERLRAWLTVSPSGSPGPTIAIETSQNLRRDDWERWDTTPIESVSTAQIPWRTVTLRLHKAVRWQDAGLGLSIMAGLIGLAFTGALVGVAKGVVFRSLVLEQRARESEEQIGMRTRELDMEKGRALVTLESIGDGVITTDAEGRIEYVNPVAQRLIGWTNEAASGKTVPEVFRLVNETTREPIADPVAHCLREARVIHPAANEAVLIDRNGADVAIDHSVAPIRDQGSRVIGAVLIFQDVSQARRVAQDMAYKGTHDALTGLPNRHLLMDRMEQALARLPWHGLVAVMYLDLDRFKLVNDTMGHDIGDELLRRVAERLTQCVRAGDTVCRLGGDEFVVLLTDVADRDDVAHLAAKIIDRVDEPHQLGGVEYVCSASAGVSLTSEPMTASALLRNADSALYRAKDSGRSNYQFYSDDMNRHALKLLNVRTTLRHAVERNELVLHYQPQVDLTTSKIVGAEALLRWNHPKRGLILPDEFISVAEESGLIFPISEWVFAEACRQNKRWQVAGLPRIRMCVNVSGRQFQQGTLVSQVKESLNETELDPCDLELELTEGILVKGGDAAIGICRELHVIGVRFSIIDFGTGYLSLTYLRRFPLTTLKLDGSFVKSLPGDAGDVAICRAIVAMAHTLNLSVVAQAVETAAQRDLLQREGVDAAQGYFFSPAVPADQFADLLRHGSLQPTRHSTAA